MQHMTISRCLLTLGLALVSSAAGCVAEGDDTEAELGSYELELTSSTFAIGMSQLPESLWGAPLNGQMRAVEPQDLVSYLEDARKRRMTVFVVYPRRLYTTNGESQGPYSASKHRALSDAYAAAITPDQIRYYVGNHTLGGINTGDDYGCAECWGGVQIPASEARDAANYAKKKMPAAPIGVRVDPEWMSQVQGWKIDYGWAQYTTKKGDQKAWYDRQKAKAANIPVKVVYGVNVHNCDGGGPQGACTPSQLKTFGTVAVKYPSSCAFVSWRYDDEDWSNTNLRNTWYYLANLASAKNFVSCKRL